MDRWEGSPWRPTLDPPGQSALDWVVGMGPQVDGEWCLGIGWVAAAGSRIVGSLLPMEVAPITDMCGEWIVVLP